MTFLAEDSAATFAIQKSICMNPGLKKLHTLATSFLLLVSIYLQPAIAQKMPALAPNLLVLPSESHELNFIWQGDSVNNTWEPHAALLLPVKVRGCKKQFYMQFDTGSPSTIFYKSPIQQIHARFPKTATVSDTAKQLLDVNFKVGGMPVSAGAIKLMEYQNPPINWAKKNSVHIIGTIGTDFIENRVVTINYRSRKILTGTDMPAKMAAKMQLTDFMFVNRAILLPAVIKGKKKLLYFDTGSSAYSLLTDKKTTELLAQPGAVPIQYSTRSWDRTLTAHSLATADSIEVASQKLPIGYSTYIEGSSQNEIDQMMKMGMGGMTGNKLFRQSILVLDTKNKKFGVMGK